jgi:two-component system sensor histidine kinase ChvG
LRKSRPSTGWAIATATDERLPREDGAATHSQAGASIAADPADRPDAPARALRHRISPLTRRILAVNVLALGLLGLGFLYLGEYRTSLIDTELDSLKTEGEISAAALSEGAVYQSPGEAEFLIPDLARQMLRRLVEPARTRARLFDTKGTLIADSRWVEGTDDQVQIEALPPPEQETALDRLWDESVALLNRWLPRASDYPPEREIVAPTSQDYPEVEAALRGETGHEIRRDRETGDLVLNVAVPVQHYREVLGAVMVSTGSRRVELEVRAVRVEVLKVFLAVLGVTVLLSIYLAGAIARPIRRLAIAAERVRRGHGRQVPIPDLTKRRDEIGELSGALREMTDALWRRMDAIEHFAADVAHEIKNPLTSLKSAVETAARVDDPEKQRRLLAVVVEDVARLDRLITDISDASRLDAEMSRIEPEPVPIADMLEALAELHEAVRKEGEPALVLALPTGAGRDALTVQGMESRLGQVFRNLIANAISFSPPHGAIRVAAQRTGNFVTVTIEDDGPGIPEGKLEAIFDRFYSERPAGEKFGTHSGLGLSISKQIVEAHRGTIRAENRRDATGATIGARFIVRLPAG